VVMSEEKSQHDLVHEIISKVASHDTRKIHSNSPHDPDFNSASVLIPLAIKNGEIHILLTKRSKSLRRDPGTVSFPGGKKDETDESEVQTALREAEEEIGLPPKNVEVVGILHRGITPPNTIVYPVVGMIPSDFVPVPNPDEVEFAFFMPLKDFVDDAKVKQGHFEAGGRKFVTRSLLHENGEKVIGFTAGYCVMLAKILFEEEFHFPVFHESENDDAAHDSEAYLNIVKKAFRERRAKSKL